MEVLINLLHHHLLGCKRYPSLVWVVLRDSQRISELALRSCHHQLELIRHLVAEVLLHLKGANLLHLTLKERLIFCAECSWILALSLQMIDVFAHLVVAHLLRLLLLVVELLKLILPMLNCHERQDWQCLGYLLLLLLLLLQLLNWYMYRWNCAGRFSRPLLLLQFLLGLKLLHLRNRNS